VKPESRRPLGLNYKHERDTALQRCFQFVKVDELDDKDTMGDLD
jgi:ATP-dependent Clp protease ATP-binding subunit ClpA